MRTSEVVSFLDANDALALGKSSPWPAQWRAEESVHQVGSTVFGGPRRGGPPPVWPVPPALESDQLARLRGNTEAPESALVAPLWDVDSWYQPVHFHGYDGGLFIRERPVVRLAGELARFSRVSSLPIVAGPETVGHVLREAFLTHYLHALFHHRVECLAVHMQVVGHRAHYVDYVERAYRPAAASDDLLEEALANAFVYRMLSRQAFSAGVPTEIRRLTTTYLKGSWSADRPGYREAARFTAPAAWAAGLGDLHSRVQEASNRATRRAIWRHLGPDLTGSFLEPSSDVFVVADSATPAVVPRAAAAPTCSPGELIGVLERAGYRAGKRSRGLHVTLKSAGRPTAVVPSAGVLSPGVVARNLELIGSGPADLPALLGATRR